MILQPKAVIDCNRNLLLGSEITLRGVNRRVSQEKLDLLGRGWPETHDGSLPNQIALELSQRSKAHSETLRQKLSKLQFSAH